jgi:hypothetical protein
MRWTGHVARIGEEKKFERVFGEKARRKESTRKTKAQIGGWDQNESYEDGLEECRVDQVGSE